MSLILPPFYIISALVFTFFSTLTIEAQSTTIESFLHGAWKNTAMNHTEAWVHKGNKLNGYGIAMEGNDTLFYEKLEISLGLNPMVYTSWVKGQNGGHGIEFKLTESADTSWTFENPKHDFPKRIQYIRTGEASMEVKVTGHQKNKPHKEYFYFVRMQE